MPTPRDRAVLVATDVGARLLHATERFVLRSSMIPTTPFLDPGTFPWIADVEAEYPVIRDELDDVLRYRNDLPNFQDISVDQASITDDDGWKTFFFFAYGFRSVANCERCPNTAAVLDQIPGVTTAFFSILSPQKHIGEHRGPWRGVLRYHLALKVPEPASAAGICVGGEVAHWEEGRSLLFDDGYVHRAWNDTDGVRVVLFVDVIRPLRPPAKHLNDALIWTIGRSPYIRDARHRHEAWERRFGAMKREIVSDSGPKPDADLFAKINDRRLDEYRAVESLDLIPFYRELEGEIGTRSVFRGRPVIMLGSNNYLGLTTDPRVRKAAKDAVDRYGTGVTGSRLLNGTLPIHRELEELLADWVGMEAALVFTTGYAANLGLIGALVGQNDATVVDSAAHASLVDGTRYSEGTLRAFRHNRPNSLRRTLRAWREQPGSGGVLVAVDGIYSMEGDWAPLAEIAAHCQAFGARLLIDEAHALGVVGPEGAGTAADTGIRPDLIMGTFSKSLASCGGFVAGPAEAIEYLKITCRPLMFTASGVPAALASALVAARIARAEEWRRESVHARAENLRQGLAGLGYRVAPVSQSPIVAVHVGDNWEAGLLWRSLSENGVYTNCAIPPAVPKAMLRTSVMATHTEADIDAALEGFSAAR